MRNFKLILEYEGTAFCGWQTQKPGLRTVQSHLEEKLAFIFNTKVHCHASGRTDSGVHAKAQVAHVKVKTHLEPVIIHKALNSFLDKDVSIVSVEEVSLSFHAQTSAVSKTYQYTILNRTAPSALWRNRVYVFPEKLNVTKMKKVARHFVGKHDFKSFQASASDGHLKSTIRTVSDLTIIKKDEFIYITISANGFLHKMVRNIVGSLLEAGVGRLDEKAIPALLKAKNRTLAPKTAPSCGLCLMSVSYK